MEVNIILDKRIASDYFRGLRGEGTGQEYDHYFFYYNLWQNRKKKNKNTNKKRLPLQYPFLFSSFLINRIMWK